MYKCICKYCGKEFNSRYKDVQVCKKCKNRPCEVCGKSFVHEWPYDQHCCSKKCREIFIKDPERNRILNEQRKATIQAKYGVDNVAQLKEIREKIQRSRVDSENYFAEKQAATESKVAKPLIRKCAMCGKEFVAVGSQVNCPGPHFKACAVCGKEFKLKGAYDSRKTCSDKCQVKFKEMSMKLLTKVCQYCGKEFTTIFNRAKFCPGPHYATCEICGKQFEIDVTAGEIPKTCSTECANERRKQTCLEKYGYSTPSKRPEAIEAARQKSIENEEQRKQTCLERYGYEFYVQSPQARQRASATTLDPEVNRKARETMRKRYGVNYSMQSPEFARKHSNSQFSCTASDGTRVDSKWELAFYEFLLRNGIEFEYNTVTIPVEINGEMHTTHIDFKVGELLFEIKGSHLLEGIYDYEASIPIEYKLAAYRKNHVILITDSESAKFFGKPDSTESNGLKYLDKCPEPLIGIDISLFTNPQFPFAEDRPPCFYKVKVDGGQSSLEAFFDEKIRWKMILNRINYSGGFITAKSVLNAMNVTRTCKPPSWFSKTLAKQLITDYCTSDTIVDPFAGWGMRHDAAIELHKNYVGSDYNPELVGWHQRHNRNIQLADANKFTYQNECSVFICPPYSDPKTGRCFEDYSFEGFDSSAKALSQCDWLKVVMQNVPNASEYVMVCKIIDEGWRPYVVKTLTNRSHLGTNNEYVIVVNQDQRESILSKSLTTSQEV